MSIYKAHSIKQGYKRTRSEAAATLRDKLAAPIRSLFEVVKSLVRKKPGGRKRRKTSNQAGRVHYVASEVSLVYALRCIDENCPNVTDAYTACLVDVRDGNEVFGTVRNAERHYKKHHSVEISAGDGGSIEDNGIDANAEPPATPQGHRFLYGTYSGTY